jgi:target of rapamycin complex subunit LST8
VRLFEIASQNPNPVVAYDGHTTNVTDIGFQKDSKWMFTGSEDGSIKVKNTIKQTFCRDASKTLHSSKRKQRSKTA